MKVLLLASWGPSLLNFRGNLIQDLLSVGHNVAVCAPEISGTLQARLRKMGVEAWPVRMQRARITGASEVRTIVDLWKVLNRVKPHVLLAYTIKPVVYGSILAKARNVPSIYCLITGQGSIFHANGLGGKLVRQIVKVLYRISLKNCHGVFFQNNDDQRVFINHRLVSPDRTIVVPGSGVNLDHFAFTQIPSGMPCFLMLSRLLKQKGVMEYVEAARIVKKRHPEIRFQLAGPVENSKRGVLKEDIEQWSREGVIEYHGFIEDVRSIIESCHIFVLPSYYGEGVPRSVLEAMAIGRPIITTNTAGCRDTVMNCRNGVIVEPRDAEGLADAMEELMGKPELLKVMGRESRIMAEELYDVRKVNSIMMEGMGLKQG